MEETLKFYRDRLQTLKDNRAESCDTNNDAENHLYDKLIEYTAEFCQTLNRLKEESDNKDIAGKKMQEALKMIEDWKLPSTGKFWDREQQTQPMSYEAAYGSNGVRDYIRSIAREGFIASGKLF